MNIRPATPADADGIVPMLIKTFKLHGSWDANRYGLANEALERYRQWFGKMYEDPRATAIVAEDEGKLVGFLTATVETNLPFYQIKEYAVLRDVWVEPEYRNQHVGRRMVRAAAEHFRKLGVPQMRATVAAANDAGRQMLQNLGFNVITMDMLLDLKSSKQIADRNAPSR